MSAQRFEAFLAKLYVDEQARQRFLSNPRAEATKARLTEQDFTALEIIDLVGLELAADSYAKKRATQAKKKSHLRFSRWFHGN
jgi:hypothetical protein